MSHKKVSYQVHVFPVFSTIQEKSWSFEKLGGYISAVISAHTTEDVRGHL